MERGAEQDAILPKQRDKGHLISLLHKSEGICIINSPHRSLFSISPLPEIFSLLFHFFSAQLPQSTNERRFQ